jgi:transcription antitermination factor NusG
MFSVSSEANVQAGVITPADPNAPEVAWMVAHTRPRCEKKLSDHCGRHGLALELPMYKSVKRYRHRKGIHWKPLFPGYAFVRIAPGDTGLISQSGYVARLIKVIDQVEFANQLAAIQEALASGVEVYLAPEIVAGSTVRVKSGPLRGMEAWVQQRLGQMEVLLRLDFIGQAAAVRMNADELEPL